ncbi:cupin domain-containing protein [Roseomonas elaeocarpi]|uniref:Cupin domain-containing protein n=1 Tax=Roseomonas elaeocarpi TaxID=907779 RepID=A0ABV6JW65_9PROT
MTRRTRRKGLLGTLTLLAGLAVLSPTVQAQGTTEAPALKRTPLQQADFPDAGHASILMQIDVPPNFTVARHTHPGIEIGYVLSGTATLSVQGQPERTIKAGDSFLAGEGVPHVIHTGPEPLRIISTYVVAKDKPLATPAPQ